MLLNFTSDSLQYEEFLNKIKSENNMWQKKEYINKAQDVLVKDLYTMPVCFFMIYYVKEVGYKDNILLYMVILL